MPLAAGRVELPLACTLDGGAAKERVARWSAVLGSHRIDREVTGETLLVRFRRDAAAERELTELVAAERECCGFLGWHLDINPDHLALHITGDRDALASLNFSDAL